MKKYYLTIIAFAILTTVFSQKDSVYSSDIVRKCPDNDYKLCRLYTKNDTTKVFTGFDCDYYDNNTRKRPSYVREIKNGLYQGKVTSFYKNGNKQEERIDKICQDSNDDNVLLQDGIYYCWYSTGQIKTTGKYSNGMKVGSWKTWDEKGNLLVNEKYKNGILIM